MIPEHITARVNARAKPQEDYLDSLPTYHWPKRKRAKPKADYNYYPVRRGVYHSHAGDGIPEAKLLLPFQSRGRAG